MGELGRGEKGTDSAATAQRKAPTLKDTVRLRLEEVQVRDTRDQNNQQRVKCTAR